MQSNPTRDWIDQVFDDLEGRAVNEAVRFRLLDLVETAGLEDMEEADIIMSIESDELTRQEADELWRRLLDAQPYRFGQSASLRQRTEYPNRGELVVSPGISGQQFIKYKAQA